MNPVPWLAALALAVSGAPAAASEVAAHPGWSALASDPVAAHVGDSLTVLVSESAQASNTAQKGSKKATHAGGRLVTDLSRTQGADLDLNSGFDGAGQSARADRMIAQISVVVEEVLANGDLRVAGEESLDMNGQHSRIRVRGRVRPADISAANTVSSSRLSEAQIVYDGAGFVSGAAQPGLVSRLLGKLGLF